MSYRNKYVVLGANGLITLSIPIVGGRNQRTPSCAVQIDYQQDWQKQHFRTIISCYNRSPFFEYYQPELEALYNQKTNLLADFNFEAWRLVQKWLRWKMPFEKTTNYNVTLPETAIDLRLAKWNHLNMEGFPIYNQVFDSNISPNISLLDLLFNFGPMTGSHLEEVYTWVHKQMLTNTASD